MQMYSGFSCDLDQAIVGVLILRFFYCKFLAVIWRGPLVEIVVWVDM